MALVEWIKSNITDNEFAEENIDYEVFVPNDENPLGGRPTMDYGAFVINDGWGGQAMDYWGGRHHVEGNKTQDYKLSSSFAKKLERK